MKHAHTVYLVSENLVYPLHPYICKYVMYPTPYASLHNRVTVIASPHFTLSLCFDYKFTDANHLKTFVQNLRTDRRIKNRVKT